MKNPIKQLQEEHQLLLQAIKAAGQIQNIKDDKAYHSRMNDVILFFRNFSEIYHHPKEEQIFYPALKNKSAQMSDEFLFEICDNHADFKSLMAEIENFYVLYDYRQLRNTFANYLEVLAAHIKRENKIILSVADQMLSDAEKKKISEEFDRLDERFGDKEQLIQDLHRISLQAEH